MPCSHLQFFCIVFVSGTLGLDNTMFEQYYKNAFSPFLNG